MLSITMITDTGVDEVYKYIIATSTTDIGADEV